MYVTRPLSLYMRSSPDLVSSSEKPEAPNSGYLIIQDEESTPRCCFGTCKDSSINRLPFPQNKLLYAHHSHGETSSSYDVYLIPVVNQPLSSNRYYAIKRYGKHKGKAYVSSKEEDMTTCCCFCKCIKDVNPKPLDPNDIYQQFEFSTKQSCGITCFTTKSVANDGNPPHFFRGENWTMYSRTPKSFSLNEAKGMNETLRANIPSFSFPATQQSSTPIIVGKWYIPFMFVKDKMPKEQVKKSLFYEMNLEQRWERIFVCENENRQNGNNTVIMDVVIPTELVKIKGNIDASRDDTNKNGGVVWFKSIYSSDQQEGVGLSSLVVDRMVWEEERFGWVSRDGKQVRGVKTEEYGQIGWWTKFGCYVLVETFVLRRIDGSVVLTYDFLHTDQLKTKWE